MNHLILQSDTGPRFVRMVTVCENGFPANGLEVPGDEWLRLLAIVGDDEDEVRPGPIEVSVRGRCLTQAEALKKLRDALKLAKSQIREAGQGVAEDASSEVLDARTTLQERIDEVSGSGVPMVDYSVIWVVEADDVDTLDRRTDQLVDYYGNHHGIRLWAPSGDQELLWKSTVIGDVQRVKEFNLLQPMTTLAGAWFHGGSAIGEATGPFLARNAGSTPGPFRCRLSNAQLDGDGILSGFVGGTGGGKSTAVMLSILAEAVLRSWVCLLDLKGDLSGLADVVEWYGVQATRVSTADVSSGALDPFRYVRDHQKAADMCVDNLMLMLGLGQDPDAEHRLHRAASQVVACKVADRMSSNAVICTLAADPDERTAQLGERLLHLARHHLARPVAGVPDLTAQHLSLSPGLVYFLFEGLTLPGKELPPEQYKPGHRLSSMLVQAGVQYAAHVASSVTGYPKVLALTELHLISGLPFGQQLISDRARMGRAQDVNLLLDTQACGDLLAIDGLVDQMTATYAFRARTTGEADAQARLLGLEPSPRLRAVQQAHRKGQCLAKDRASNVAALQFDYLSAEIAAALDTTPKRTAPAALQPVPVADLEGVPA